MVKSGIIYKIYDRTDKKLVYYGSTEKSLSKRLDGHIYNYKRYKNGNYHFITSYLVIDSNNYDIIIVETVEFDDVKDLWDRERFYIENNICVNNNVPNRTEAEWREANAERIAKQRAVYYNENKDKIAEQHAQFRKENKAKINEKFVCVCGGYYTRSNKAIHEKTKKHQVFLTSIQCDKK